MRFNQLSEAIALADAQNQQVEDTGMLNIMRIDNSIVKYSEMSGINSILSQTKFYISYEPDLQFLTCWFTFDNFGSIVRDSSFMGNDGQFIGDPTGAQGPDKGLGVGGTPCLDFDGLFTAIHVPESNNIRKDGNIGFSIATLVNPDNFNTTISGVNRYIVSKVDDAGNMFALWIDPTLKVFESGLGGFSNSFTIHFDHNLSVTGGQGNAIHFWVFHNGTSYSVKTDASVAGLIQKNQWYWIIATFANGTRISNSPYSINFTAASSQYITVPYSPIIDNFTALTVSCWIYRTAYSNFAVYIHKGYPNPGWFAIQDSGVTGNAYFSVAGTSTPTTTASSTNNVWHHIVGTWNGSTAQLYVDGVLRTSVAAVAGTQTNSAPFEISNVAGFGDNFNGNISDVRIYNVALTSTEISQLHSGNDVIRGERARFTFNEGTGTTTTDIVSSLVGTLTNGPTWSTTIPTITTSNTTTSNIYLNGKFVHTNADRPTETGFEHVKTNMFVGCNSGDDGFFSGLMSDFRYYYNQILNQFDAYNLNQNMITTAPIKFGQVGIVGSSIINPGIPSVITSAHFTSKFTGKFT